MTRIWAASESRSFINAAYLADRCQMNGPYTRPSQRRAMRGGSSTMHPVVQWTLIVLGVLVVGWLAAQWHTKINKPYMQYWGDAVERYESSLIMLQSEESMCGDSEAKRKFRLQVKSHYDQCETAERIVRSYPAWIAFGRLMDDFEFCPSGTCMQFDMDMLSMLGLLFVLFVTCLVLVLLCVVGYTCRWGYQYLASKHDLPLFVQAPAFQLPACHKQHEYPPPTHAYDFNAPRGKDD